MPRTLPATTTSPSGERLPGASRPLDCFGRTKRGAIARRRSGFTLVELSIVVAVLIIMFAFIVPNLVAATRGITARNVEAEIVRLPLEARNGAVKSGLTETLQLSGNTLTLQETQTDGTVTQIKQVDFTGQFTVTGAQLNGQTADTGTWQWSAYADGTTDNGGLQFDQSGTQKSLILPAQGNPRWIKGELPDPTQQQWPAGELLQRT